MSRLGKWWRGVAYIVLVAIAIVLIVIWWPELSKIWREHFTTFMMATLVMLGSVFVQATNFLRFLPADNRPKTLVMVHTWAVGGLVNYLGPFQPGMAMRIAVLAKLGIPVSAASVATLRQTIMTIWLGLALASISLLWTGRREMMAMGVVLAVLCVVAPTLFRRMLQLAFRLLPRKIHEKLGSSISLAFKRPSIVAMLGIFVQYVLGTLVLFVGYRQFGVNITVMAALGLACVFYISSVVAIVPGNLGVLEALCTGFGQINGLAVENSLALAFLYRGASIASLLIASGISMRQKDRCQ